MCLNAMYLGCFAWDRCLFCLYELHKENTWVRTHCGLWTHFNIQNRKMTWWGYKWWGRKGKPQNIGDTATVSFHNGTIVRFERSPLMLRKGDGRACCLQAIDEGCFRHQRANGRGINTFTNAMKETTVTTIRICLNKQLGKREWI